MPGQPPAPGGPERTIDAATGEPIPVPPSDVPGERGNWGGAAADPETGVVHVKANEFPSLLAPTAADPEVIEGSYGLDRERRSLNLPYGLPINKPP